MKTYNTKHFNVRIEEIGGIDVAKIVPLKNMSITYSNILREFPQWYVPYVGEVSLPRENRTMKTGNHRWEWRWKGTNKKGELIQYLGVIEIHTNSFGVTELCCSVNTYFPEYEDPENGIWGFESWNNGVPILQ